MVPVLEKRQLSGISLVMIEHRLRELFRLADRVLVMNFGEKIAEDSPGKVLESEQVKKAYLGPETSSC